MKKAVLIISIVLVLAVVGGFYYHAQQKSQNIVTVREVNLSPEQKDQAEKKIVEQNDQINTTTEGDKLFGLYLQRGYNQQLLGRLQEAKDSFNKALEYKSEKDAGVDVAYLALFEVEQEMQDFRAATRSMKKALSIEWRVADYWRRYAEHQKEYLGLSKERVYKTLEDGLEKTQNDIDVLTFYASTAEQYGDIEKSIELWRKAIEVNKNNSFKYEIEIKRLEGLKTSTL